MVNFYTSKGWYGTFVDGEVVKNGVATNLDKDSVKKGDIIRGITSGMAEGLWQIQVIMLDVPKETVVPTYKDRRGRWRCIYPNENGVAMTGIILHSPRMLVEELVIGRPYPAHRCNDNFFELE